MNDRTSLHHDPLERIDELLADRALFGLDPAESAELERLLAAHPDVDADAYDLAAAALDLAIAPAVHERPPAGLHERVHAAIRREVASGDGSTKAAGLGKSTPPSPPATSPFSNSPTVARRDEVPADAPLERKANAFTSIRERLGWLAAAACLLAAVFGWSTNRPPAEPSAAERRERLLASEEALVRLDWTATEDPAAKGASGDVVWNNARQEGYMRFHGLAGNDPTKEQYQLWIFDENQDERYPIDGGVFNVDPTTGDVIVPIRPAIRVVKPTLFAITVEKPGGVVVSSRGRLPLLAKAAM